MRILVTGKEGQVAQSMLGLASGGVTVIALGRPDLDVTDRASIDRAIAAHAPEIVVNAAAYTAVDRAEDEPDIAFAVNAGGAGNVAAASAVAGIPIVQISTDYVFPGKGSRPLRPDDPVGPLSVYGRSKLDGERAVAAANPAHVILRTAWVYSPFGANFVKTMLRLAADRDVVRVVADQQGAPTSALDLAGGFVEICRKLVEGGEQSGRYGTHHLVAAGSTSWAEFAQAIFRRSAERGGPSATVQSISTSDYPTRATRPAYSVLDMRSTAEAFGVMLPPWQEGLTRCVDLLVPPRGV